MNDFPDTEIGRKYSLFFFVLSLLIIVIYMNKPMGINVRKNNGERLLREVVKVGLGHTLRLDKEKNMFPNIAEKS